METSTLSLGAKRLFANHPRGEQLLNVFDYHGADLAVEFVWGVQLRMSQKSPKHQTAQE